MAVRLPLSTLLSFALVAFTIEFDNEAEHRQPHRTTEHGGPASAPWLVSMAMYLNCLQWVPEQGIAMRELEREARTEPNWEGMRRWGYVYFEPDPNDPRTRPPKWAWLVRTTVEGRAIQETMGALLREIEERWRKRFGESAIQKLRGSLTGILRRIPDGLPDCMPILHYSLVCERPARREAPLREGELASLPLPVLLARVLLALALEFEEESPISLAICANILRVLEPEATLLRRIPGRSGVSKVPIAMGLGYLARFGFIQIRSQEPARRGRIVLLTSTGAQLKAEYPQRLRMLEERSKARSGEEASSVLRTALEALAGDGTRDGSPLFQGLNPCPEGWRAKIKAPATLPHFPMVLHRGGFPDGS